jgi:hypothetical protein
VKGPAADAIAQHRAVATTLIERCSVLVQDMIDEVLAPERRAWEAHRLAARAREAAIKAGLISADEAPLPTNGPRKAAVVASGRTFPELYRPRALYEDVELPGLVGLGRG